MYNYDVTDRQVVSEWTILFRAEIQMEADRDRRRGSVQYVMAGAE